MKSLLKQLSRFFGGPEHNSTPSTDNVAEAPPQEPAEGNRAVSSDIPITQPTQDAYGVDNFAQALAKSISRANAAEGLVFAIYGAWGSGKSSACNLVLHHLKPEIDAGRIGTVTFNPWWFSGSEALTVAFFQELSVAIGKSVSDKTREVLARLGTRLSSASPLIGGLASLLGLAGPAAALTKDGSKFLGDLMKMERTVEQQHDEVAKALRDQTKKFLIVIDDIDRLGTDEALQIFRLVKSVGRLPNVIYLLAFDRSLADKMVAKAFPAEGASFLDKFIQGGFDLPQPNALDLREAVLRIIDDVMGAPPREQMTRFLNVFYTACAPLIRIPRDAVLLGNAIRVSWPAIANDVDKADYLALEALRLFLPSVHAAIRLNPNKLCGSSPRDNSTREQRQAEYEDIFLTGLSDRDKEIAKTTIRRLFPRTEYVWANVIHSENGSWHRDRLVCSDRHFWTYFNFGVDQDVVASGELHQFLVLSGNVEDVAGFLRDAVARPRRREGTRAALMLEELRVQAAKISEETTRSVLRGLFSVADEINVKADKAGAGPESNRLRIHWLLNDLLFSKYDQPTRGQILEAVCPSASLAWLVDIAERCKRDYAPSENQQNADRREPHVAEDVADRLWQRRWNGYKPRLMTEA